MARKTADQKEKERILNQYKSFCEDYNNYGGRLLSVIGRALLFRQNTLFTDKSELVRIKVHDNPRRYEFAIGKTSFVFPEQLPKSGPEYNEEFQKYCSYSGTIVDLELLMATLSYYEEEQKQIDIQNEVRNAALSKLTAEERKLLGL